MWNRDSPYKVPIHKENCDSQFVRNTKINVEVIKFEANFDQRQISITYMASVMQRLLNFFYGTIWSESMHIYTGFVSSNNPSYFNLCCNQDSNVKLGVWKWHCHYIYHTQCCTMQQQHSCSTAAYINFNHPKQIQPPICIPPAKLAPPCFKFSKWNSPIWYSMISNITI